MILRREIYAGRMYGDTDTRDLRIDTGSPVGMLFNVPTLVRVEMTYSTGRVTTYSRIDEDGGSA